MGAFFVYSVKSAVCLVLFYLFFRLLLSKETFHRFNRVVLLGVMFASLSIPCIEVTTHQEVQEAMFSVEQWLLMAVPSEMTGTDVPVADAVVAVDSAGGVPWMLVVLLVYVAGMLLLVAFRVCSLVSLCRLIRTGDREELDDGITLVVHEREMAPFSWMKYVVISRKDLEENGREILIHERAHIRHHHSVDLLLADACILFQWFNPAMWLLKQELQNVHEYEADETVIDEGVSAREYQLLLIKKAVGTRLYSMANSFNHSKLKKRITMMLKEKSSPWARLKVLCALPLAAFAVAAFARPEISEKIEEISAVKVNELMEIMQEEVLQDTAIFEVVEKMPSYPGGEAAMWKYLDHQVSASKLKGKVGGSALVGFTVTAQGKVTEVQTLESDHPSLNAEAERIVGEMPDWNPGKQRGVSVPVKYSVPVNFGNVRFADGKEPLVLIDGEDLGAEALKKCKHPN